MRLDLVALAVLIALPASAGAAEPAISVSNAWAPAADKGADTGLYMKLENGGMADAIVRIRCAAANFTELRTVDRGEGFPSARSVKAIPIAAHARTELTTEGWNIRLLQLTQPLVPGEAFDCTLRLRGGEQISLPVTVRPADASTE